MALRGSQGTKIAPYGVREQADRPKRPLLLWLSGGAVFCLMFVSVGAIAVLLRVPALPNCPSVFWPIASASVRLYCAELAANKKSLDDLLEAIALLEELPPDHELRSQADRYLEQWTRQILSLAEDVFQAGDLEKAIATVKRIPAGVSSYRLVESTIATWQGVWDEATALEKKMRAAIAAQKWDEAGAALSQLRQVKNNYWSIEKSAELRLLWTAAREDADVLTQARRAIASGSIQDIKAAIVQLQKIAPERSAYGAAQVEIDAATERLLSLARQRLVAGDGAGALEIARDLPTGTDLQAEASDLKILAESQEIAAEGTAEALELAVSKASQVGQGRPLYSQAQQLVGQWRRQAADGVVLARARDLARGGDRNDFIAAIAEARKISSNSPLSGQANQAVKGWSRQFQILRDRPTMDAADGLASAGTAASLQQAIARVQKIPGDSPFAAEAREKTGQWNRQLAQLRDRPRIEAANARAAAGDWQAAVRLVQALPEGSPLRGEAQTLARRWQGQMEGASLLARSRNLASGQSVDGLVSAMATAGRIGQTTQAYATAQREMDRWGRQLLDLARSQASRDPAGAIATARRIPQGTSAAQAAQPLIREWQQWLQPTPVATPPATAPDTPPDTAAPSERIEDPPSNLPGGWQN